MVGRLGISFLIDQEASLTLSHDSADQRRSAEIPLSPTVTDECFLVKKILVLIIDIEKPVSEQPYLKLQFI